MCAPLSSELLSEDAFNSVSYLGHFLQHTLLVYHPST
jgi:hypothetical protein